MTTSASPYRLPPGNVQIAFSGGRTSAFMLHQIVEANGGIPEDRVQVVFANTGREMPQTLDFVAEIGQRWGVAITWVEYRASRPWFEIVGYQGASRYGEPFDALIERKRYLPNQAERFCTEQLKVRAARRYLVSLGWRRWTKIAGIRADEPHRHHLKAQPRETLAHPLVLANVGKPDVAAFWSQQAFDLRLPNVKGGCWLGNCDGCFLKSEADVAAFSREFPLRALWWERHETEIGGTFSKRYTRRQMREMMERQGDFLLSTVGALCQTDEGECTA